MKYSEIKSKIETAAPLAYAASWDNSGLQLVAQKQEIKKICVCLDPSVQNIQKAVAQNADLLLAHHPLLLEAKYLTALDNYYFAVQALIKADLALYSAHTSLDVTDFSRWLAKDLNLSNCRVLSPVSETQKNIGYGAVGDLPQAVSMLDFEEQMKKIFPKINFRYAGKIPQAIQRVAFCGGSGASMLTEAKAERADIYISGDFKYHNCEELETFGDKALFIMDVGHFAIEEEMMKRFCAYLQKEVPELEWNYLSAADPFFTLEKNNLCV